MNFDRERNPQHRHGSWILPLLAIAAALPIGLAAFAAAVHGGAFSRRVAGFVRSFRLSIESLRKEVARHLEGCAACRALAAELDAGLGQLIPTRTAEPAPPPAPRVATPVRAAWIGFAAGVLLTWALGAALTSSPVAAPAASVDPMVAGVDVRLEAFQPVRQGLHRPAEHLGERDRRHLVRICVHLDPE